MKPDDRIPMIHEGVGLPDQKGRTWREKQVERLTQRAVDCARRRDVEGLVRCIRDVPLQTLLHMRSSFINHGDGSVVVDTLIAGLHHPNPAVRHDCAQAMDHLADDRCVEPLRQLLHDPVPRVRRMALHALSCETCKLSPLQTNDDFVALAIEQVTLDPSINVRRHAAAELGARCADPRAIGALNALVARESDATILRYARRALRHQRVE